MMDTRDLWGSWPQQSVLPPASFKYKIQNGGEEKNWKMAEKGTLNDPLLKAACFTLPEDSHFLLVVAFLLLFLIFLFF
jgi:hypothetical protein